MEQNTIEILEALKRIEKKIDMLSEKNISERKITTAEIRDYISDLKNQAKSKKENFIVLTANDIHNQLKLESRMPMVCNAMYQRMNTGDEVLHRTKSGYSSTLRIKYYIDL